MRRSLTLAALALSAAAVLPVSPASACDPGQDPRCLVDPGMTICTNVDRVWFFLQSTLADPPPPQPVC